MKRLCCLVLLVAVAGVPARAEDAPAAADAPAPAAAEAPEAPEPPTYIGSDLCIGCHEDRGESIKETPHRVLLGDESRPEGLRGCEACHGPGSAHFEAGGDGPIRTFQKSEPADQRSQPCRTCHAATVSHVTRGEHARAGVACNDCHMIHGGPREHLLARPEPRLCYGCHPGIRARFALPEHHEVDEGVVACHDCHDVHGSSNDFELLDAHDRTCTRCHADMAGPFVFEHVGRLTEGCTGCHEPHGSLDRHLLKRQLVGQLCYGCHTVTPASHMQPSFRDCTRCHVAIHGSNTDPRFFER
jgi:DmsE family decaheme c-type cytochrome